MTNFYLPKEETDFVNKRGGVTYLKALIQQQMRQQTSQRNTTSSPVASIRPECPKCGMKLKFPGQAHYCNPKTWPERADSQGE